LSWIEQAAISLGLVDDRPLHEPSGHAANGHAANEHVALTSSAPPDQWDDWVEIEPRGWPGKRVEKHYSLVPTTCFNCESACGLLA
jgi:hypothetical protein